MSSKKSNRKSAKKNQATPGTTAKILGQFEGNISARGELHIGLVLRKRGDAGDAVKLEMLGDKAVAVFGEIGLRGHAPIV